ncbi:Glycerol-3-phosphate acyltransferase, putative [Ricinus communis]|uniref:Glycerol-3-phosphate acyltransferase, putative n=1 Tax=Ricinus communis TaxID=3988 RepID=B9RNA7_RICCO|nr:Glycerol-3-phosphate acyltransferase, putative [Ricinus communis]
MDHISKGAPAWEIHRTHSPASWSVYIQSKKMAWFCNNHECQGFLFKQFGNHKVLHRSYSSLYSGQSKYQRYPSLARRSDLSNEETGLKIMVMVCFFGIKKESLRVGRTVLPKFFLEDVGLEAFELLKRGGRKVAVSDFPQVMIESFLRDYLEIDCIVGRELKSVCGYFVGVMEEKNKEMIIVAEKIISTQGNVVGISRFNRSLDDHQLFSQCKEIYLVRKADKRSWQRLPRDKYPNPLIFHDGRLAMRPTPLSSLALFMWVPFGVTLAVIRVVVSLTLPYSISIPILVFSGIRCTISKSGTSSSALKSENKPRQGLLYVCNHRTLLDPLYLCFSLKKNFTAVTYSLSRTSEILAPIRTVRLTRNRDKDAMMMEKLLSQGDLVVCPEGTTCREPYLLRFSPLFSEMSETIVPVALNSHVSMFYGTTAGGLKCLDPLFFLMNPLPVYTIQLLKEVSGLSKSDEKSRYDVANHVQSEIGKSLGFECTKLTRRDKYLILAGNEGFVSCPTSKP